MQYNNFLEYFSMFSCICPRFKLFRRGSKIFRNAESSSKVKDLPAGLCKIFQRYCKDIYSFTEMNKLKSFKNVFKIFSKIFENLGSLKITGLQRFL